MQFIWYLPSLAIGIFMGLATGYWQAAIFGLLMVSLLLAVSLWRNRYPKFELSSKVQLSQSAVAIDNRVLPHSSLFWKSSWHQIIEAHFQKQGEQNIFEQALVEREQLGFGFPGELPIWLGVAEQQQFWLDLAVEGPHLLVVGPTGSGKSELLRLMLLSLSRRQLELALFDLKGGAALGEYSDFAIALATDLDIESQRGLWQRVSDSLAQRELSFVDCGVSSIEQYHALGHRLPRLVIVVDEFAAALSAGAFAQQSVEDVLARGRSLGIHLIAATQSLSGLSRAMLVNLRLRIALMAADPIDMVQLGINPSKLVASEQPNWPAAVIARSNQLAKGFNFPIGFSPATIVNPDAQVSEQAQPLRSQLLRQECLDQAPMIDQPPELPASQRPQLLSRMAGLRWSERR